MLQFVQGELVTHADSLLEIGEKLDDG